jgi:hypothetical protein
MPKNIDYRELRELFSSQKGKADPVAKKTFSDALFKGVWRPSRLAFRPTMTNITAINVPMNVEQVPDSSTSAVVDDVAVSERKELFAALDDFVTEEGSSRDNTVEVNFRGGKVTKTVGSDLVIDNERLEQEHLKDDLNFYDDIKGKSTIFFCEKPNDLEESERDQDLLSKMIDAMKLGESFARVFLNKESLEPQKVWEKLVTMCDGSDLTIVSMGAFATNTILRKKERLSKIHGKAIEQSYSWNGQTRNLTIFPVFHPDILRINPNMKRSAWLDLQKVIKHIRAD